MEEALGTYPAIMSLIRDRAKILWAKHNAENKQKLTKSTSDKQSELRLSIVPHQSTTTTIMADIHSELHTGDDQNHPDGLEEETEENFLSKMEVCSEVNTTSFTPQTDVNGKMVFIYWLLLSNRLTTLSLTAFATRLSFLQQSYLSFSSASCKEFLCLLSAGSGRQTGVYSWIHNSPPCVVYGKGTCLIVQGLQI